MVARVGVQLGLAQAFVNVTPLSARRWMFGVSAAVYANG